MYMLYSSIVIGGELLITQTSAVYSSRNSLGWLAFLIVQFLQIKFGIKISSIAVKILAIDDSLYTC